MQMHAVSLCSHGKLPLIPTIDCLGNNSFLFALLLIYYFVLTSVRYDTLLHLAGCEYEMQSYMVGEGRRYVHNIQIFSLLNLSFV